MLKMSKKILRLWWSSAFMLYPNLTIQQIKWKATQVKINNFCSPWMPITLNNFNLIWGRTRSCVKIQLLSASSPHAPVAGPCILVMLINCFQLLCYFSFPFFLHATLCECARCSYTHYSVMIHSEGFFITFIRTDSQTISYATSPKLLRQTVLATYIYKNMWLELFV